MPQETKKEKTGILMPERSDHTANCPNIATPLVTTIAAVQKARVMIALPWMKSTNPLTSFCLANLYDRRRHSLLLQYGDSFVSHSRNSCADAFLKSDLEWLFFLDDDMLVPCGTGKEYAAWFNAHAGLSLDEKFAGQHTIDRLLSTGKSLVGAVYCGRSPKGKLMYHEGASNPTEAAWARKGPYENIVKETRWCATGALLINRSVFLAIERKFPRLARGPDGKGGQFFSSSEHTAMELIDSTREFLSSGQMDGNKALKAYQMLEDGAADARRKSSLGMGEDVAFAIRAKESGHPAFVDHQLWCAHVGQAMYHGKNTTA